MQKRATKFMSVLTVEKSRLSLYRPLKAIIGGHVKPTAQKTNKRQDKVLKRNTAILRILKNR